MVYHIGYYQITNSVKYTAKHDKSATVVRLFLLSASITATVKPTVADMILDVAVKIAGIVMAVRTAYGM